MRFAAALAVLAATPGLAAGSAPDRSGPALRVHGRTSLTIRVWPRGKRGATRAFTLRCRPAGGTLPHPGSACERLARIQNPFAPVPTDVVCAQIYGGPQIASVRGVYRARRVQATFNRRSACEIARWDRVAFLFPLGSPQQHRAR
ncbi:MAG TPA: SSI family serine proteinase inhibitor [Gaiellaceae bacterium]